MILIFSKALNNSRKMGITYLPEIFAKHSYT